MNIPIFKLEFEKREIEKFKTGCEEIFTSQRPLSESKYVQQFEEKFAKLVDAPYALAVTNGTVAIEIALRAMNVRDKIVLLPSNTFFATSVAVTNAGGKIGLVDIEAENFSIDPERLEKTILENLAEGKVVGAVIVVHVGGIISKEIRKIKKICDGFKIPLIEDAAQAHCSTYDGLHAGTIGKIGCFSFFPTKVMTTGEGGIITTKSKQLYELMRSLKNFGRDNNDGGICINPDGCNGKITEFTGLLGSLECDRVLKRIKRRNQLKDVYVKRLKNSGYQPILQEKGYSSQYKMILRIPMEREWLRTYCKKHKITLTGEVYKVPIHQQPLYKNEFKEKKFPVTDTIALSHICPPLYPELKVKEIHYICDVLLAAEKEYEK